MVSNGRELYVANVESNSVSVIDTTQRKKIASIAVGRNPIQLFVTPDGHHVYVAHQGTETHHDNTVSVIDTRTGAVTATIVTGAGAHGVVISDDGTRAFISNIVDNSVSVIDTATQRVLRTIEVGPGPNGITYRNGSH